MMGLGGMGGSETTKVEIPQYQEDLARSVAERGQQVGNLGYAPYYGPDVAAFNPQQIAAMNNLGQAANAFGMEGAGYNMPAPTDFGNGMYGYSSAPLFEQSLLSLQANRPDIYNNYAQFSGGPGHTIPNVGLLGQPAPMTEDEQERQRREEYFKRYGGGNR